MSEPLTYQKYQERKYLDELDGLRALSVLLVVTVHMHDKPVLWHWLDGWNGVTIFFVLSGYLITTLSLREEDKRGKLSLSAFFIRRSFRIFPLYYLVLALYCLLIFVVGIGPEKVLPLKQAMPWYLLYMQEVPHFFGVTFLDPLTNELVHTHTNIPFYQSWSLGIEEKFYLVWPLLAFVWLRGTRDPRMWMAVVLVIAFALTRPLFALIPGVGPTGSGHGESFAANLANCLYPYYSILLGCLVAIWLHDRTWYERLRFLGKPVWVWATLCLFLVLHFLRPQIPELDDTGKFLGYLCDTGYIVAVSLFSISVLLGEGVIQQALRWKPLVFTGRLSYGIYLIHVLCLNAVQMGLKKIFGAENFSFGYTDEHFRDVPPSARNYALWQAINDTPGKVALGVLAVILTAILSIGAAWVLHIVVEKPLIEIGRKWSARVMGKSAPAKPAPQPAGVG